MASWQVLQETEDALADKATFCLRTGIAPSEYDNLTDAEVTAFIDAFNAMHDD